MKKLTRLILLLVSSCLIGQQTLTVSLTQDVPVGENGVVQLVIFHLVVITAPPHIKFHSLLQGMQMELLAFLQLQV